MSESKRLVRWAGGLLLASVVLACLGFFVPRRDHLERTTTVAAPQATVFALVNGFRTFTQWSAWAKSDPAAKFQFGGPNFGTGATMRFEGSQLGTGEQRIVESVPFERIKSVVQLAGEAP